MCWFVTGFEKRRTCSLGISARIRHELVWRWQQKKGHIHHRRQQFYYGMLGFGGWGVFVWTHVDERGTTILVNLSYLVFHSLTRFLEASYLVWQRYWRIDHPRWAAYFGTATRTDSRYSESWTNWSDFTTSASDRTERFPLNDTLSITRLRSWSPTHVFFRCNWVNAPFARLYELSLFFMTLSIDVISCNSMSFPCAMDVQRNWRTP